MVVPSLYGSHTVASWQLQLELMQDFALALNREVVLIGIPEQQERVRPKTELTKVRLRFSISVAGGGSRLL